MKVVGYAQALEVGKGAHGTVDLWDELRSWLARFSQWFAPRPEDEEEDDLTYGADPAVVAALQMISSFLDDEANSGR